MIDVENAKLVSRQLEEAEEIHLPDGAPLKTPTIELLEYAIADGPTDVAIAGLTKSGQRLFLRISIDAADQLRRALQSMFQHAESVPHPKH